MKKTLIALMICAFLYGLALAMMHFPAALMVHRERGEIMEAGGVRCPGTLWKPAIAPRAVLLAGHGVTANQGIMNQIAIAFANNGYAVVAFDFRGHGRSRDKFDWQSNPERIQAWCGWARETYPGLPLAYLGYSMGGFAGTEAFLEKPAVDAFVALGALPRKVPECPTLVAAGTHEELFTIEQARKSVGDRAKVVSSPFSDHALEASDPVLIGKIMEWVNGTFGFADSPAFPWVHWCFTNLALILGTAAALFMAEKLIALCPCTIQPVQAPERRRRWSVNPYRLAGGLLGCRGGSVPPRSGKAGYVLLRGAVFSILLAVLLSWLLDRHIFTCRLDHPERLLTWLLLTPMLAAPVFLDKWILERLPYARNRRRFLVTALTQATPLLILCIYLRWLGPGIAFAGMMFGILAFVAVMLALVYALVVRAARDWRAGAAAVTVIFAWLVAFWFPLSWPWML